MEAVEDLYSLPSSIGRGVMSVARFAMVLLKRQLVTALVDLPAFPNKQTNI